MRTLGICGLILAVGIASSGQDKTISQMYRNILAKSSEKTSLKPQVDELVGKLDAVRTSSVAEIDATVPLAWQCLQSPNEWARLAGYQFFLNVNLRFDSAKILEPYIDELEKLSDGDDAQARLYTLIVLGGLLPTPPDKVIDYLEAKLERSGNTHDESLSITANLLQAARVHPTTVGPSIVHKVLTFVSAHPETDLTSNTLHNIGLLRIQVPEAISFISANLDEVNPRLRAAAVEGASRLDKDSRAQLSGQLSRIASDPKEDQNVRTQAAQALKP